MKACFMHFMYVLLMTCQHERRWSMRDVKAFRNHEKYAALWPRKQSSSCIKLWLHHNRADGSNPFLQNLFTQKRKCSKNCLVCNQDKKCIKLLSKKLFNPVYFGCYSKINYVWFILNEFIVRKIFINIFWLQNKLLIHIQNILVSIKTQEYNKVEIFI